MFIMINGIPYNGLMIQSIRKEEKDGKYFVLYGLSNGYTMEEEFATEQEMNDKYNQAEQASPGGDVEEEIHEILANGEF